MKKRIRKKKWMQKQRRFCHPEEISMSQCPKCGWDAAEADPDMERERFYPNVS